MEQDGQVEKLSSLSKGLRFYDLLLPEQWQSSKSLGQQLGVDSRTIKSYAASLRAYGWPVESQNGRGKGYKLDGMSSDSLRFTSRDLFFLAILLAHGASTLPQTEAKRLTARLKSLLPQQARNKVNDLEELIAIQGFAPKDWDLVEHVGTCLYDRCYSLVLHYKGRADVDAQKRHVLPQMIRPQNSIWYLDLFDLDKGEHRSFRFDRIERAVLLRQDQRHPDPPRERYEDHKWDFGKGDLLEVCLEVSPGLVRWLLENPEHPSQRLEQEGGRHFARFFVRRLELFADWTMGLRGARVVSPAELSRLVQQRARAWMDDGGTLAVEWE